METNLSNIHKHLYLTSAKAVIIVPWSEVKTDVFGENTDIDGLVSSKPLYLTPPPVTNEKKNVSRSQLSLPTTAPTITSENDSSAADDKFAAVWKILLKNYVRPKLFKIRPELVLLKISLQ